MTTYNCPRCGYNCSQKGDIKKHFKRKKICSATCKNIPIEECILTVLGKEYLDSLKNPEKHPEKTLKNPENEKNSLKNSGKKTLKCSLCSKGFSRPDNLKVHLSSFCKYRKTYTHEEVEEIKADKNIVIAELKNQIEVLLTRVGDTNIQNQNNTYIVLNAFGKEDTSYIQDGFVKNLIKQGPYSSIPRLIKAIHFNPDHQQNHNIKIPNVNKSLAKIYNGEEWEYKNKKETIDDLTDKAYNIIEDHYDGGNKHMDQFIDEYDNEKTNKKIHKETEIMILNNQDKNA